MHLRCAHRQRWVLRQIVVPTEELVERAQAGQLPAHRPWRQAGLRQVLHETTDLADRDLVRIEGRVLCHEVPRPLAEITRILVDGVGGEVAFEVDVADEIVYQFL